MMEKRTFWVLGLGLTAMASITTGVQTIAIGLVNSIDPDFAMSSTFSLLCITALYIFGLPVFWLFVRRLPTCPPEAPIPFKGSELLGLGIGSVGAAYIFNYVGVMLMMFISTLKGQAIPNALDTLLMDASLPLVFVISVVCAPIFEELIFRKILLDRVKPFGDRAAILYSALAFGLYHMNLYQFFYAAALGAIFAYAALRTGNIKISIALHMLLNFFGSFFPLVLQTYFGEYVLIAYNALIFGTMAFAAVWFPLNWRKVVLRGPRFRFSCIVDTRFILMNAGSLFFAAFCAVYIIAGLIFV